MALSVCGDDGSLPLGRVLTITVKAAVATQTLARNITRQNAKKKNRVSRKKCVGNKQLATRAPFNAGEEHVFRSFDVNVVRLINKILLTSGAFN